MSGVEVCTLQSLGLAFIAAVNMPKEQIRQRENSQSSFSNEVEERH